MTATLGLMRALPGVLALALALPVVAAPRHARADSFVELGGGITIPVGDDDWTDLVETSPKVAVAAGTVDKLGAKISFDWTPETTDAQDATGPFGSSVDFTGHRFRVLAHFLVQAPLNPKVRFEGQAGIGADIAYGKAEVTVAGSTSSTSDTDVGLGFEAGGGFWFDVGSVQLGALVALPVSIHDNGGNRSQGQIELVYTSYDVDLLFGVRLGSH